MDGWLRQSTARTVKVGPFVDSGDGDTEETGLTIAQADIRLSKNGGAYAQTNNAAGATHDEKGEYGVPLDTTDTGTLGILKLHIHVAGALHVWGTYMVLPANVWDSLCSTDKLQVHAAEISAGLITAAAIATDAIDADAIKADAVTEIVDGIKAATWTAGGAATLQDVVKAVYSMARGKVVVTGDAMACYDDDDATLLFTLTLASSGRTTV